MDDDEDVNSGISCDTETCMVVEIQENELGEIMLVERPREEVFANNRFCVVDCEIDTSAVDSSDAIIKAEHLPENIEIVYLPDYNNPDNEPIMLKQELVLDSDNDEDYAVSNSGSYELIEEQEVRDEEEEEEDEEEEDKEFLSLHPEMPPKVYKHNHKRTLAEIGTRSNKLLNGSSLHRLRSNILKRNGITVLHDHGRPWARKINCKDFVHSKGISSVTTIHTKPKSLLGTDRSQLKTEAPDSDIKPTNRRRLLNPLPHKCPYCDQSFRQSISLQIHSTLHRQSIPDSCHVS